MRTTGKKLSPVWLALAGFAIVAIGCVAIITAIERARTADAIAWERQSAEASREYTDAIVAREREEEARKRIERLDAEMNAVEARDREIELRGRLEQIR